MKLDADTLATVPVVPPAAGPERALDPPPPAARGPDGAEIEAAAVPVLDPVLAVALTMP
ncbi:MAG TPA: hypothetical protein VG365_03370 [Solirubrobacteraceae bacterium]|nr:hypothetical protein [Solirubrobacteraceae bacterium]